MLTLDKAVRMREHIWISLLEVQRMHQTGICRYYNSMVVCSVYLEHVGHMRRTSTTIPSGERWLDSSYHVRMRDGFKRIVM